MSGAGGRPEARYTWDLMQDALSSGAIASEQEKSRQDAELDREPVMGAGDLSWFKFLVIMTAHGWFLRPRAFPLLRDGGKASVTPSQAIRRVFRRLGISVGISTYYLGRSLRTAVCGCINTGLN